MHRLYFLVYFVWAMGCDQAPSFKDTNPVPLTDKKLDKSGQTKGNMDGVENKNGALDGADASQANGSSDAAQLELTQVYSSHELMQDSGELSFEDFHISKDIELTQEYRNQSVVVRQRERPFHEKNFKQGQPGEKHREDFVQLANRDLDILVVIDNSKSMAQEQRNLATKLEPLLSYVVDTNWRLAVITTDDRSCIRDVISYDDDPSRLHSRFLSAIKAGTRGSGNERGVYAAVKGLSTKCRRGGWLRDKSTLALLIVSDEDNCSNGRGCQGKDGKPEFLIESLKDYRQPGVDARIYGLFWHPSQSQSQCRTGENVAHQYAWLVEQTGGTWGSICDEDYSNVLGIMSKHLAGVMQSSYTLKYPPTNKLVVKLNGKVVSSGFKLVENVVQFDKPLPEDTKISFEYNYEPEPIKRSFVINDSFDPASLVVKIDSQIVDPSTYTLNGNILEFKEMPSAGSWIAVGFRKLEPLPTRFDFKRRLDKAHDVKVLVGEIEVPFDFEDKKRGIVELKNAPRDGLEVKLSYRQALGPQYVYDVKIEGNADSIEVFDKKTAEPVRFVWAPDFIEVDEEEFVEGRQIVVRYRNPHRSFELELTHNPSRIDSVEAGGQRCDEGVYSLDNKVLDLRACPGVLESESVQVAYTYFKSMEGRFPFTIPKNADPELSHFTVHVEGREVLNFGYEEGFIQLRGDLPVVPVDISVSLYYYPKTGSVL